jgi:hypothetical protein
MPPWRHGRSVKHSASALLAMPMLCIFPLIQTGIFAAFTALWMLYSVYLISSGEGRFLASFSTSHIVMLFFLREIRVAWSIPQLVATAHDTATGSSYKTIVYDKNSQEAILFMVSGGIIYPFRTATFDAVGLSDIS